MRALPTIKDLQDSSTHGQEAPPRNSSSSSAKDWTSSSWRRVRWRTRLSKRPLNLSGSAITARTDRKRVVQGKRVSDRVDIGVIGTIKKQTPTYMINKPYHK